MKSVSICYASQDRERAEELARFIEVNFGFEVPLDDAVIDSGCDILGATERALSANFAVALLSPASLSRGLPRDEWERAFVRAPVEYGTPIAFVLLGECPFPEILRRARFFDGSRDFLACMRGLKRWMMSIERGDPAGRSRSGAAAPDAAFDSWWRNVIDRPGAADNADADSATRFMTQARDDFERILRVRCAGRPVEVILGELGRALELTLPGPAEENMRAIRWHAMAHRYLILFDGPEEAMKEQLRFGGRCSVLMTNAPAIAAQGVAVEEVAIGNIGDAIEYALARLPAELEAVGRLAARIASVLSDHHCYAEAALVLEAVRQYVPARAEWAKRELEWIHERWGESVEIPPGPIMNATQLDLFGDAGCGGDDEWMAA